eukprot:COSAG02_NODE_1770_length_10993_cov_48.074995_8_plen_211_part_00
MDTFNEAAEVTERLNRDHNAELDEQLRLFADSRQKATAFQQLADTIEILTNKLKDTYCKMHRAATTLQGQLPTERQRWNGASRQWEWVGQDDNRLSDEAVKEAESHLSKYEQAWDFGRLGKLRSSMQTVLNKALKTEDIPHRVVNSLMLTLKHDFPTVGWRSSFLGATSLNSGIGDALRCMRTCDEMVDILWDKSLTVSLQHPSKRRRTE